MRLALFLIGLLSINTLFAQKMNDSIPILTGTIDVQQLQTFKWQTDGYAQYVSKKEVLDSIRPFAPNIKLIVVMGTWCSDSREHIPALLRIATDLSIPESNIEILGVDRTKKCSHPDISPMNIEYVPTIFVFLNGKMMGTIVETPTLRLEEDILHLLIPTHHD